MLPNDLVLYNPNPEKNRRFSGKAGELLGWAEAFKKKGVCSQDFHKSRK